jgi:hypothetical protein
MTHDHRRHENSLFEEFHLEPFDYSDILVTSTTSMDYVAVSWVYFKLALTW